MTNSMSTVSCLLLCLLLPFHGAASEGESGGAALENSGGGAWGVPDMTLPEGWESPVKSKNEKEGKTWKGPNGEELGYEPQELPSAEDKITTAELHKGGVKESRMAQILDQYGMKQYANQEMFDQVSEAQKHFKETGEFPPNMNQGFISVAGNTDSVRCTVCEQASKYIAAKLTPKGFTTEAEIEKWLSLQCWRESSYPNFVRTLAEPPPVGQLWQLRGLDSASYMLEPPTKEELEKAKAEEEYDSRALHAIVAGCRKAVYDNANELGEFLYLTAKKMKLEPGEQISSEKELKFAATIEKKLCLELSASCRVRDREAKKKAKKDKEAQKAIDAGKKEEKASEGKKEEL